MVYDMIMAGGGIAALSLAYHLSRSPLRDCSLLIVDRENKERNDRTLSYWSSQPTPFDSIAHRTWNRLNVTGASFDHTFDLDAYRYRMVRSSDFYHFVRGELGPNVTFLRGAIQSVEDRPDGGRIVVDGQPYDGQWLFDSRPRHLQADCLRQHFLGWEIETDEDRFDPKTAMFMDFRTPRPDELSFFYVLPFSSRRALIEYVLLSPGSEQILRNYIETTLGITRYRIISREGGISPLSDGGLPRRVGQHILNIGVRGGRIKPSTGYAFTRIHRDSERIVQSLVEHGHPFAIPRDPRFFQGCDSLMLYTARHRGCWLEPLFAAMFQHNDLERIFRFLDEEASLVERLRLAASLVPQIIRQIL